MFFAIPTLWPIICIARDSVKRDPRLMTRHILLSSVNHRIFLIKTSVATEAASIKATEAASIWLHE